MARNPKIQVIVTPETKKAIEDYADALNVSVSAATGRLLDEAAPMLVELAHSLRALPKAPAKAMRDAAKMVNRAADDANQMLMDLSPQATGNKKKAG